MIINGFGAVCTAIVMVIFAVTKFRDGAWVVLVLIPVLVLMLAKVHRYYGELARELSLDTYGAPPVVARKRVILPVSGVHQGTMQALRFARSLSSDVTAVHVSIDPEQATRIRRKVGNLGRWCATCGLGLTLPPDARAADGLHRRVGKKSPAQ